MRIRIERIRIGVLSFYSIKSGTLKIYEGEADRMILEFCGENKEYLTMHVGESEMALVYVLECKVHNTMDDRI